MFCLLFIGLDAAIVTINPWRYVNNWRYLPIAENPVISKIPAFLSSKSNPEILVIGSSLPMMAIANTDKEQYNAIESNEVEAKEIAAIRVYTQARYLQKKLEEAAKRSISLSNQTCIACMATDANVFLERVFETGKKPKLIIYGIGPRSFADNVVEKTGKTAMERVISKHRSLHDIYKKTLNLEEIRDTVLSNIWIFYGEKSGYREFLVSLACDKFDKSPTIFAAQQRAAAEKAKQSLATSSPPKEEVKSMAESISNSLTREEKLKADLAVYDIRYNPPNFRQFEVQKKAFGKILDSCKARNVKIVVIAMPITKENKALINPDLLARYESELPSLVRKSGALMLRLDRDASFTATDFYDSVHTNASGGKKIQDKLVESLKRSNMLQM